MVRLLLGTYERQPPVLTSGAQEFAHIGRPRSRPSSDTSAGTFALKITTYTIATAGVGCVQAYAPRLEIIALTSVASR